MRDNFRTALGVSEAEAEELARRQFFEYGRHTIDVWRLRSEAFVPRDHDASTEDARVLARVRRGGRGFLLVTGHVGNWEMGAVTLRAPRPRAGRRRPAGARPERAGDAPAAARAARRRVDRHRLLDGHRVPGAARGRRAAGPSRCSSTGPIRRTRSSCRSSAGRRRSCARPRCSRGSAAARSCPGFFLRNRRRLLLQRLGRAARGRPARSPPTRTPSASWPASPRTSSA